MKDYSKFIEEQLNILMPFSEIYEENKPIEYPVKDAPKVSGYFGFIGLKYMKRVRNIKKLCVEYINTYVDGSLNVLRKMDKAKTLKGAETLATEIEYGATGFSTNKKEKRADSKVGVAFLTSDKAILDKLKSIENQIKIYASKSAALTEWATLMVQKSNMIGAQIVYDKASETLDENDKERLDEEIKDAIDKKDKELEEYKKKTEEKIKGFEKYGDVSQMNHDVFSKGDIEKIGNTDYKQELEVYGNDTELGKNRVAFYSKNNWNLKEVIDNTVLDSVIQSDVVKNILNSINNDNDKEKVENVIKNYAVASYLAKTAEVKKSNQYLSPYDLQILAANLSGITNIVKKENPDKSSILKNAEFGNLVKGDDLNKIKEIQLDNEKIAVVAAEWKYTFGEESTYLDKVEKANDSFNYNSDGKLLNETKHYVMGWNEFLNEHLLKK